MNETNTTVSENPFSAKAILVGQRIVELNGFTSEGRLSDQPRMVSVANGGTAALFRYGVVVFFKTTSTDEREFLEQVVPQVRGDILRRETEELSIIVEPNGRERIEGNRVYLADAKLERLQLVASALSKSVVLAEYESVVADTFERIEPLAVELQHHGRATRDAKRLLQYIGEALLSQHRMVGRAEIRDKPELLWEHPHLEPLYLRLEDELEIGERHSVLDRKLDLISRTAQTMLELLHTQQGHRLEKYIIFLIVVEIVLIVCEQFLPW